MNRRIARPRRPQHPTRTGAGRPAVGCAARARARHRRGQL